MTIIKQTEGRWDSIGWPAAGNKAKKVHVCKLISMILMKGIFPPGSLSRNVTPSHLLELSFTWLLVSESPNPTRSHSTE